MQYELRTQVIEPTRNTFTNLVQRHGDRPASRYEEGTFDLQPKANFHYRPLWDPDHEIYDEGFSRFRLTDPYSFTDPRQFYYAPYVTSRAAMNDAFAATLDYVADRDLFTRMPQAWSDLMAELLVPLRHYESGAQMIFSEITRFGFGTSITQCAGYAAFDRIGNAQSISRVGIALDGGSADLLLEAKARWLQDPALQGLRRYLEEVLVERDWGKALVRIDVADQLVYHLLATRLDDVAVDSGAGTYSLVARHLGDWFTDHRRWVDALYRAWRADPEHGAGNAALLDEVGSGAIDHALDAVRPIAQRADALTAASAVADLETRVRDLRTTYSPAPTA